MIKKKVELKKKNKEIIFINRMKKVFLIIFACFISIDLANADRLGFNLKKVDFNFDCNLDTYMLKKAGYPENSVKSLKNSFGKEKIGYKKFVLPENEELLLSIYYDKSNQIYSGPMSTVLFSYDENGQKVYTSYDHGGGMLLEYKISELDQGEMFLMYKSYKLDKTNHQRFDKKIDEAFKLPDDGFVINLKSLTKEYDEYAKNSFKTNLTLPYICKII